MAGRSDFGKTIASLKYLIYGRKKREKNCEVFFVPGPIFPPIQNIYEVWQGPSNHAQNLAYYEILQKCAANTKSGGAISIHCTASGITFGRCVTCSNS